MMKGDMGQHNPESKKQSGFDLYGGVFGRGIFSSKSHHKNNTDNAHKKNDSSKNSMKTNEKQNVDQQYDDEKKLSTLALEDANFPSSDLALPSPKSAPVPASLMRRSDGGASTSTTSSSSGSIGSGSSGSKSGGGAVTSSPSQSAVLKVGTNNSSSQKSNQVYATGELSSMGSISSGGSSSSGGGGGGGGGSPTAESVRRSGRSVRTGNLLNTKSADTLSPDNRSTLNLPTEGNLRRPVHSRSTSYDSFASYKGSLSRSSGELSSGGIVNSKLPPHLPTGNILSKASVSSTATSSPNASNAHQLPYGNILPSGTIGNIVHGGKSSANKSSPNSHKANSSVKADHQYTSSHGHVLGHGSVHYGHGSIMKGTPKSDSSVTGNIHYAGENILMKRAMASTDPEDVKNVGNEQYKKGHFQEALILYDRAISLSPGHAPYRSNRAAALTGLGRLAEAVQECHEAIRLDSSFARAHHRLGSLYLKLGQVENARRQFNLAAQQSDRNDIQRLQAVEKHIIKCTEARSRNDWNGVLRESDAAIVAGAESSPQVFASKAEALFKLHRLDEAEAVLLCADKAEGITTTAKFHGMIGDSYVFFVRVQVDMALGRFENAVAAAERAAAIDTSSQEVASLLHKARAVANARSIGNELYKVGKYMEASKAYGEGLEHDPLNSVLLCNRAACRWNLEEWDKSLEDCNDALNIQPRYLKALYRKGLCHSRLAHWKEAVSDLEIVRKEWPKDRDVAAALFQAQVQLKQSRGEEIYNMKFGGEVETVSSNEQFKDAVNSAGPAVVHFKKGSNEQCKKICVFLDQLCQIYPSVNFLKVDIDENPALARLESVTLVPTFKIYKNGVTVKEMLCPSQQFLENSVKHYCL